MFDSEFRKAGNYNKERATPILGLCQGAFIDQFIFFFRYIVEQAVLSRKMEAQVDPFISAFGV